MDAHQKSKRSHPIEETEEEPKKKKPKPAKIKATNTGEKKDDEKCLDSSAQVDNTNNDLSNNELLDETAKSNTDMNQNTCADAIDVTAGPSNSEILIEDDVSSDIFHNGLEAINEEEPLQVDVVTTSPIVKAIPVNEKRAYSRLVSVDVTDIAETLEGSHLNASVEGELPNEKSKSKNKSAPIPSKRTLRSNYNKI